jgi:hypothetical protein
VGEELGRDALARVGHLEAQVVLPPLQPHLHAAAPGSELDGVGEQVPGHLLQAVWIADDVAADDLGGGRLENHAQLDPLGLGRRAQRLDGVMEDGGEVDPLEAQRQAAPDDARDVQDVVDDLGLRADVLLDRFQGPFGGFGVEPSRAQQMDPADHGVERRA